MIQKPSALIQLGYLLFLPRHLVLESSGFWVLVPGSWVLSAEFRLLRFGFGSRVGFGSGLGSGSGSGSGSGLGLGPGPGLGSKF